MRISTPLRSRARKDKVMSQCVTRTRAECRGGGIVSATAEAEVPPATDLAICKIYHWRARFAREAGRGWCGLAGQAEIRWGQFRPDRRPLAQSLGYRSC